MSSDPPLLHDATILEGTTLHAHTIVGAPAVMFAAFLDGTQRVRIRKHEQGAPIIEGTVAAVIRERRDRRLVTWRRRAPIVRRAVYAPLEYVRAVSADRDTSVVDTSYAPDGTLVIPHPKALYDAATARIRQAREAAEEELAEAWCVSTATVSGAAPLYMDGSIRGSTVTATSPYVVGVIKSHQTLYVGRERLGVVMGLRRGQRSSVFRVEVGKRTPAASWYLRLRDPRGQDAMFGLVRVEVADQGDYTARADDVSRWILAEVAPLSLPDPRWDKMVYGIRDCEQFLRAIAS